MARALALARRGLGSVEPNPMVGCVVVQGGAVVGEGWHERFGGPHAEALALQRAGIGAEGGTLYVSLEPCCHFGKTPPCTQAIIAAGIRRVVAAMRDPFPQVSGGGLAELAAAGLDVSAGLLEEQARELNAPYLMLVTHKRPWVIAKWAMSLDGKIATRTGDSRWISGEESRQAVHRLRGRVDAVLVGRGTAEKDDPLLTPRPPGQRTPLRIVADTRAALSPGSRLALTARESPVLVCCGQEAPEERRQQLAAAGCEILVSPGSTHAERISALLHELGARACTNLLVEGGSRLLGGMFDADQIDEVHVFLAPKLIGGEHAPPALAGQGIECLFGAPALEGYTVEQLGTDICLRGRLRPLESA